MRTCLLIVLMPLSKTMAVFIGEVCLKYKEAYSNVY